MPTNTESVRLFVGGLVHDDWDSYEVDSDLLIPADAWRVSLTLRERNLPQTIKPGTPVDVLVGNDKVMVGRIDQVRHSVRKGTHQVQISGRDRAAVLLDCSSSILSAQWISLADVVVKLVATLGIKNYRIEATATRIREKINVNPGESVWQVLTNVAEANGLWPWFEPDGTLVVGGPTYDKPAVATLIVRYNGKGNNTVSLDHEISIHGRYSQVTVLGQKRGTGMEQGRYNIKETAHDDGVPWYRPKTVTDYDVDSNASAMDRARKLLADSRLKAFTLAATVVGHRIGAPDQPGSGLLWTPGQRVRVISEPHQIDDVFFLMGRRFSGGRSEGAITHLKLKEDRAWVLDAHPHKRLHRCKKGSPQLEVLDATHGATK